MGHFFKTPKLQGQEHSEKDKWLHDINIILGITCWKQCRALQIQDKAILAMTSDLNPGTWKEGYKEDATKCTHYKMNEMNLSVHYQATDIPMLFVHVKRCTS